MPKRSVLYEVCSRSSVTTFPVLFQIKASDPGAFDNSRMGGRHPVLYRLAVGVSPWCCLRIAVFVAPAGSLGRTSRRLCFRLSPWQSLSQAISVPRGPSGRAGLRRFQAKSRRPVGWIHTEFSPPIPSGFVLGTPHLSSVWYPAWRGLALDLQRLARPWSTGSDGGEDIHEVLRSGECSVRWCCRTGGGQNQFR